MFLNHGLLPHLPLHGAEDLLHRQMLEAEILFVNAGSAEVADAFFVWLDDLAEAVEVAELVLVENVVDEDDALLQRQANMKCHRHAANKY